MMRPATCKVNRRAAAGEDSNEVVPRTPDFMERLKQEADERSRLGLPVNDAVKP